MSAWSVTRTSGLTRCQQPQRSAGNVNRTNHRIVVAIAISRTTFLAILHPRRCACEGQKAGSLVGESHHFPDCFDTVNLRELPATGEFSVFEDHGSIKNTTTSTLINLAVIHYRAASRSRTDSVSLSRLSRFMDWQNLPKPSNRRVPWLPEICSAGPDGVSAV